MVAGWDGSGVGWGWVGWGCLDVVGMWLDGNWAWGGVRLVSWVGWGWVGSDLNPQRTHPEAPRFLHRIILALYQRPLKGNAPPASLDVVSAGV